MAGLFGGSKPAPAPVVAPAPVAPPVVEEKPKETLNTKGRGAKRSEQAKVRGQQAKLATLLGDGADQGTTIL